MILLIVQSAQKVQKYLNNKKRLNVYIALYYEVIIIEYNIFNNINVFINENKYR